MSPDSYNLATAILLLSALVALLLSCCFLVAAIFTWRKPTRNRNLALCATCFVSVPALIATQQALLWFVFLPSFGAEAKAKIREIREASSLVQVGAAAPGFKLSDTMGVQFDLDAQRGKVVLVNFFATWCGPCLLELPHVQKLWDQHRDDDRFALLVIGREESDEKVARFQLQHGYTFRMAADLDRSVFSRYANDGIPRCYLIGADGNIAYTVTGFDEEEFKNLESEIEVQLKKAASEK